MVMRIEIEIEDGIEPQKALDFVRCVIGQGKISEGERGKKYYCWATTFNDGIVVFTRQYRKNDCFLVKRCGYE